MQPSKKSRPSLDGVRRVAPPPVVPVQTQTPPSSLPPLVENDPKTPAQSNRNGLKSPKKRRSLAKLLLAIFGGLLFIVISLAVGAYVWYQQQLAPVSSDTSKHVRVTIEEGTAPSAIAKQLKEAGVIRSQLAFAIYTRLTGTQDILKAGAYNLQPSVSTQAIVDHLVSGKQDTFRLTFLPGDTLASNRQKLLEMGYGVEEVDAALSKTYDRPLFAAKPAGTDLEGYIFGETYEFDASATVESILNRTFDEYEAFIRENDLTNGFQKQGLNLYQGIVLASIIQKEVSGAEDSRQVAQVFLKRLAEGMPLGADATFVYAAKKAGQQPTVGFQSPYNTRIHAGLPPGPISAPGVNALRAVANPAPGDYLYFVSGDDGKTYFSRTAAEHEANTRTYCIKNCALF